MHPVRNSVKALIIRDNKLLCIQKSDEHGAYYLLPGGGQEKHETFVETVKRECLEELGADVEVRSLRYIREYIGRNHEFSDTDDAHQVEFMFECRLLTEPDSAKASHLDEGQSGLAWVDIEERNAQRVYPKVLIGHLLRGDVEVYWGDVN
ncbi:MAG: NUDIX hydrolase [Spirochaetes bacterium GWB1_59_5]|nr:MAG: NUDIX hydrolase [Spirochaetes bacterium GWB1_59_5]